MLHITLPGIRSTIFVLLIINLGMIMNSGFEAQYQLKNDLINSAGEVIDTYVLNKSFFQGADCHLVPQPVSSRVLSVSFWLQSLTVRLRL
jgi:ABC-type polysaccharide transport system permease subunit